MKSLRNCIEQQIRIDNGSLEEILSKFTEVSLSKGDHFLHYGTICRKMAFIESGFLRMYNIADGKEITLWIGGPGKFITSISSFVFQTSNFWNIQALTNAKLFVISRESHLQLSNSQAKWLEFDNLLLAQSFALLEQTMFSQLYTTAQQRFENLLEKEPELFQNVPLYHIASMLGIAPESLSRLRKNLGKPIS